VAIRNSALEAFAGSGDLGGDASAPVAICGDLKLRAKSLRWEWRLGWRRERSSGDLWRLGPGGDEWRPERSLVATWLAPNLATL